MKRLLNTLYVTTENAYLSLDGENVVVKAGEKLLGRIPLHTIDGIVAFGYSGASPALMGKCAEYNKPITFLSMNGKFLARTIGKQYGSILLRREQYCMPEERRSKIAARVVSAKLHNSAAVLRRAVSDHPDRIDKEKVGMVAQNLKDASVRAFSTEDVFSLRGIEGECAEQYFSVFDQLILRQKSDFQFRNRNRRPPLDNVNAMLSFGYSLLTSLCVSAAETAGLDAYCGFFHTDRPGRCSLALDLEEEFRAYLVDRMVLSLINKGIMTADMFCKKESGAVLFTDEGKKAFIGAWQTRKREVCMHPFLKEKVEIGMLPYVQAMLLARYLRGDLDDYPPFLWK